MLKPHVIGCGAAGNKAVIQLIESGYLGNDLPYTLINSTDKDIPANYRNNSMIFGSSSYTGGCGKERSLGKQLFLNDKINGVRSIDHKIDPYCDFVVICGSTEGGSGSASIPILSKYIAQVLKIPVVAVLFFGFNDDARGMQNSIEICQELPEDIGVISICNSKFMDEANKNKLRAEKLANEHFCKIMRILTGKDIYESSQNIDDTDLKKLIFTPGFISIETANIKGVKNIDTYNNIVNTSIDNTKSMDSPDPSAKRIGVIFNVKAESDNVDFNCTAFKSRYGTPYELFVHVQSVVDTENPETVTVIASGQKLPIDEVTEIFENYKKTSDAVDRSRDNFFDTMNSFKGNPDDDMFNMFSSGRHAIPSDKDKESFFKDFGLEIDKTSTDVSKTPKSPKKVNTHDY